MSGYKIHFLAGAIITALAGFICIHFGWLAMTPINIAWLAGIAFVFSLLPDIDIGTSIIRKVLLAAFVVFIFINGMVLTSYVFGAILIVVIFLPHRGVMHTVLMGALLAGMLWFYFHNIIFPIIALLNFISHLALDNI